MENKKRKVTKHKTEMMKKIGALVVKGFTNKEIATKISASETTVNYYVMGLLEKYDCANRIQLAVKIATGA